MKKLAHLTGKTGGSPSQHKERVRQVKVKEVLWEQAGNQWR